MFDIYLQKCLKDGLRKVRGDGERKRVRLSTKIPKNFQSFLRVNENKTELNQLIASEVVLMDCPDDTLVVSTRGNNVILDLQYILVYIFTPLCLTLDINRVSCTVQ